MNNEFLEGFEKTSAWQQNLVGVGIGSAVAGLGALIGHSSRPTVNDIEDRLGVNLTSQSEGVAEQLIDQARLKSFIQRHPMATGAATLGLAPAFSSQSVVRDISGKVRRGSPQISKLMDERRKEQDEIDGVERAERAEINALERARANRMALANLGVGAAKHIAGSFNGFHKAANVRGLLQRGFRAAGRLTGVSQLKTGYKTIKHEQRAGRIFKGPNGEILSTRPKRAIAAAKHLSSGLKRMAGTTAVAGTGTYLAARSNKPKPNNLMR